jgi:hypothetical protein
MSRSHLIRSSSATVLASSPQPDTTEATTEATRRSRREEQFEADQDIVPRNGQAPGKDMRHRLDRRNLQ